MDNLFTNYTLDELQRLITDGVEENIHLDYKGSPSLAKAPSKKDEIGKDVSAFANSDGGLIIYGVREFDDDEKRHLPEGIDAIDRTVFSKEWLEQVINSKIRPKISGLIIKPVDIPAFANGVAYIVEIPKSNTPHQAPDKKYYRRFNFESVPMDDYEIDDIRNRRQHFKPLVAIDYEIASSHMVYLTVANVGDTVAYDVNFEFPDDVKWLREGAGTPSLFATGLKVFPPGRVYRFLWNIANRLFALNDPNALKISCAATYTHGASGKIVRDAFEIDLEPQRFNSALKSDVETLRDMLKEHFGKLISEIKGLNAHFKELSSIAGPTGLDLSASTLMNLRSLLNTEAEFEKIYAPYLPYTVFREVLKVHADLADRVAMHFSHGVPPLLEEIEGITPEIIAGIHKSFYW